jgi:L-asparagine transporter-like permease
MWLFPWLSYAAIAAMLAVLMAMAFMPGLRQDLEMSCVTLAAATIAYLIVKALRSSSKAPVPNIEPVSDA